VGHVWLQGDNLIMSRDSREYGPVPLGLVKGRVVCQVGDINGGGVGGMLCGEEFRRFAVCVQTALEPNHHHHLHHHPDLALVQVDPGAFAWPGVKIKERAAAAQKGLAVGGVEPTPDPHLKNRVTPKEVTLRSNSLLPLYRHFVVGLLLAFVCPCSLPHTPLWRDQAARKSSASEVFEPGSLLHLADSSCNS